MYFAQINGGGGSAISKPKDLHISTGNTQKDNEITDLKLGKDYFDIVIQDLLLNTEYSFQFAWKYEDGSYSEWSASKTFSTSLESAPAVPSQPTVTAGPGLINVTWNGNNAAGTTLQNYEKVNIYVGGTYKDSFFAAGTKSIPLAKGTYAVTLRSSSSTNVVSNATSPAVSATVTTDSTDAAAALAGLDTKLNSSAAGIVQSNNNLTAINSNGITVYSSTTSSPTVPSSGTNRLIMNSAGLVGYTYDGTNDYVSFAIVNSAFSYGSGSNAVSIPAGSAYFRGEIQSSSGKIGGFSIGSNTLTNTSSTTTFGIYNATQALLGFSGGIKISNTGSGRWSSYMVEQGFFVYPSAYDGNNEYSGAFFVDQWRITHHTYGFNNTTRSGLRLQAVLNMGNATSGSAELGINNTDAYISFRKLSNTEYLVRTINSGTLNNKQLRNIYVSSTAGEPNPAGENSPATGDIKLEW